MNNFDLKAVSQLLGHASTIITFDKNKIVVDCEAELNDYIERVKPKEETDDRIIDVLDTNLEIECYIN